MLSITKLIPIENVKTLFSSTNKVLSSRASSLIDLQKAAKKEQERVLVLCFNNLKNTFLKQWFEQFIQICGFSMYDFLKKEEKLTHLLRNKFLSKLMLNFYRNANSLQGLYTGFFKGNNKTLNDKIISHKVNIISEKECLLTI